MRRKAPTRTTIEPPRSRPCGSVAYPTPLTVCGLAFGFSATEIRSLVRRPDLEATRRIRAWERSTQRRRAPILIVSANCLKEHVDAGRAAGADDHLNKPISAAELVTALEIHMAAARRAAA
jgi:hypothetical protein